jgi:N-methylhydantoinase A
MSANQASPQVGVDVGGTNTDIILSTGDDEFRFKTPTTDDPSRSTVEGIQTACERTGVDPASIARIFHGTTIATNTVVETDWAQTGLITTEGFRDVVHIGRHRKPENFSIQHPIPWQETPVVERRHRLTVPERIRPTGGGSEVVEPLDEAAVREASDRLVAEGIETIAVCFLHSYLDPSHERRAKAVIEKRHPDVFVCTSADVVGQFREYERFTTTAINASLQPRVSAYLDRIDERLAGAGLDADVLIMQSNGGLAALPEVSKYPVRILNSGPAAGVLSADHLAGTGGRPDERNLITLDMGGTSADISVLPGEVLERDPRDSTIAGGYPVLTPMIDVEAIGSGGGSIAWFDHAKGFNIGPKSAGADPGPACYGRGNDRPTITDAQVVLGRLNPETFLDGEFDLDVDRATEAIREFLCEASDDDRFETPTAAALSTLEVANTKMQQAIREQTVRRGYDPREYTLVAFGGAGPLHASDVAAKLGVGEILVPPSPGLASARGVLTSDIRQRALQTIKRPLDAIDSDDLAESFGALEETCRERLVAAGVETETVTYSRTVDCMYAGQGYELTTEFDGLSEGWRSRVRERFERQHAEEYGHTFETEAVVLLNVRVTASVAVETPSAVTVPESDEPAARAQTGTDTVTFGTATEPQRHDVPRYDRELLRAGQTLAGPSVVDAPDSTVVLGPDWEGTVLPTGTLRLTGGS